MADWMPYPGFCDQAYQQRSVNLAVDRCINVMVQSNEIGVGKPGKKLIGRPGSSSFCNLAATGRALWGGENRMFAIAGDTLYEVSSLGVSTSFGNIGSGTAPCQIISNGTQLAIANPNTGVLKVHDGVTMQTPTTPANISQIAYLDGYAFALGQDSNTIYQSGLMNFLTWNSLDQGTRLTEQDRLVTIVADHQYLWLIGSKTSEAWVNVGSAGFVLSRVGNSFVEYGTASAFSVVPVAGRIVMLSSSTRGAGQIIAVTPGRFERISTYAVEQAIGGYAFDSAVAYSYEAQGHFFYVITFPNENPGVQWVYDFTERAWHERYGWSGSAYTTALGYLGCSTFAGKNYIMSTAGKILWQRETLYTDDNVAFRCQRVSPILATYKRLSVHGFRIDQEILDGTVDVGASLEASLNGGNTYQTARPATPEGFTATGDTSLLEWRQIGQTTQRGLVCRVTWDDARNLAVSGAYVKLTECVS